MPQDDPVKILREKILANRKRYLDEERLASERKLKETEQIDVIEPTDDEDLSVPAGFIDYDKLGDTPEERYRRGIELLEQEKREKQILPQTITPVSPTEPVEPITPENEFMKMVQQEQERIAKLRKEFDVASGVTDLGTRTADMIEMLESGAVPGGQDAMRIVEGLTKSDDPLYRQLGTIASGVAGLGFKAGFPALIPIEAAGGVVNKVTEKHIEDPDVRNTVNTISNLGLSATMGLRMLVGSAFSLGATELAEKLMEGSAIDEEDKALIEEAGGLVAFIIGAKTAGKLKGASKTLFDKGYKQYYEKTRGYKEGDLFDKNRNLTKEGIKHFQDRLKDPGTAPAEKDFIRDMLKKQGVEDVPGKPPEKPVDRGLKIGKEPPVEKKPIVTPPPKEVKPTEISIERGLKQRKEQPVEREQPTEIRKLQKEVKREKPVEPVIKKKTKKLAEVTPTTAKAEGLREMKDLSKDRARKSSEVMKLANVHKGVQYTKGDKFITLSGDPKVPGNWKIAWFDKKGAVGDKSFGTLKEAADDFARNIDKKDLGFEVLEVPERKIITPPPRELIKEPKIKMVAVAIRDSKDGMIYKGERGDTHADVFNKNELEDREKGLIDGFIGNDGKFYTREQTQEVTGVKGEAFAQKVSKERKIDFKFKRKSKVEKPPPKVEKEKKPVVKKKPVTDLDKRLKAAEKKLDSLRKELIKGYGDIPYEVAIDKLDKDPKHIKAEELVDRLRRESVELKKKKPVKKIKVKKPQIVGTKKQKIVDTKLKDITVREAKFQGRDEPFSQETFKRIVTGRIQLALNEGEISDKRIQNIIADANKFLKKNHPAAEELTADDITPENVFDWAEFGQVQLWKDPKGKLVVISGHSRTAASQFLAEHFEEFKDIPTTIREGLSIEEAEKIAKQSNILGTQEKITSHAERFRKMREKGAKIGEITKAAKSFHGREGNRIVNLSYLNRDGNTIIALKSTPEDRILLQAADWIGNMRRSFDQLTDAHENEMFKWLIEENALGTKVKSKIQFIEAVDKRVSNLSFDPAKPLNLKEATVRGRLLEDFEQEVIDLTKEFENAKKELFAVRERALKSGVAKEDLDKDSKVIFEQGMVDRLQKELIELKSKRANILEQEARQIDIFGDQPTIEKTTGEGVGDIQRKSSLSAKSLKDEIQVARNKVADLKENVFSSPQEIAAAEKDLRDLENLNAQQELDVEIEQAELIKESMKATKPKLTDKEKEFNKLLKTGSVEELKDYKRILGTKGAIAKEFQGKTDQMIKQINTRINYLETDQGKGADLFKAATNEQQQSLFSAEGKKRMQKQTDSQQFKDWFGKSQVVDADGKALVVYSGHGNTPLYGEFNPKKATAGGFYATEDPAIASNYALGKFGIYEYFENGSQYRIKGKGGKYNKKLWQIELNEKQKTIIDELAKEQNEYGENRYNIDEMMRWAEEMSRYEPLARRILARGRYDLQSIWDYNEHMGYNIAYPTTPTEAQEPLFLRQNKNDTEEIMDRLGLDWNAYDWNQPGVFPVYLRIENPIDTRMPFPEDLLDALREASKFERTRHPDAMGNWTKDYPLKQWVKDIEAGDEFYTTQIPKKALPIIKQFGYDGFKERGLKAVGVPESEKQINWIAFDTQQIKSAIANKGTFDPTKKEMSLSASKDDTGKAVDANIQPAREFQLDNPVFDNTKMIIEPDRITRTHTKQEWLDIYSYDPIANNFEKVKKGDKDYVKGKTQYRGYIKGEYKEIDIGRYEIRIYGKQGMDTAVEELIHHIQTEIAKENGDLQQKIVTWQATAAEIAKEEGVIIPLEKELFVHSYLAYLGWTEPAASFLELPQDIIQDVNRWTSASKSGKNNLETIMQPERFIETTEHPEGFVEKRGFKFGKEAELEAVRKATEPPATITEVQEIVESFGLIYNGIQRTKKHGNFITWTDKQTGSTHLTPVDQFNKTSLIQQRDFERGKFPTPPSFSIEKREGQDQSSRLEKYVQKIQEDLPPTMEQDRLSRLNELERKSELTPEEKVERKNLRKEKRGFAALDPLLRRRLSTDIKRRIKTIQTGYKIGSQEKKKHIIGLQADVTRYAKLFLPRGQFMKSEVTRLISATVKAHTLKSLQEAFDKIKVIEDKVRRRTILSSFNKLIRKADPTKGDPQFVTWIRQIRDMTPVQVQAEIEKILEEAASKNMDLTDKQDEYFYLLNKYSDIKNKSTDELEQLFLDLSAEMEAGRSKRREWLQQEKERRMMLREQAIQVITGGKGVLDADEARAKGFDVEVRSAKDMLSNLGTMSHSWEMILDKLSKFDKGSEPLRSWLNQKFAVGIHNARNLEGKGVRESMEFVRENMMRIFEQKNKRKMMHELDANSTRQETGATRTKLSEFDEAGVPQKSEEVPLILSQNEAAHLLMAYEDPQLSKTFERMGINLQTIEDLRRFVKPKVMEWAKWQLEVFYPQYYPDVDAVYLQMRGVHLPFNSKYIPIRREVSANIADAEFLGDVTEFVSIINGSLLPRIANTRPLKILDIDRVLVEHIVTMEHFKAFAPIMRDIRAVFNSEPVRKAVSQYHGGTMLKIINRFSNDFARGGVDRKNTIEIMDKIRSNFIRSVIGINPVVTIKQLTSFPAFAMDIPNKDFIAGIVEFAANPIPKIKFLMKNSEMLRTRYHKGWERDIILAMSRARKTTAKELTRKFTFTDASMMFTKFGDGAAILFGGWGVYKYHKKQALKAGRTPEEAHKKAMLEFEMSTKRAQQAGDVEDLGELQRQGSWQKMFTIFMTAPKQYFSNASAAYRNILYKRGSFSKNMKRLLIAHSLLPMLFQFAADGFRWDKDHMLRAAVLGSFNGILILGDIMEFLFSSWQGDVFWEFDETPIGSMVGDTQQAILKLKQLTDANSIFLDDVLETADAIADATSKPFGVPYQPIKKLTKGIMDFSDAPDEESFLRIFGYPKHVFEEEPKLDPMVEEIKQDEKRLKKLKAKAREMPKIKEFTDEAKEFEKQLSLKKSNSEEWKKYQEQLKLERDEKRKNDPFAKPKKPKTGLGKKLFNPGRKKF
jgi:hypothetical protein